MISRWSTAGMMFALALALTLPLAPDVSAQRGQGGGRGGGQGGRGGRGRVVTNPREGAPIDLVGQWVSVITEDYRFRMVTPPRGDYSAVPLTPEGVKVADSWSLSADKAAGTQCKAFGAAGLLRNPLRIRIGWQDDNTLKLETDAGSQTRLFTFTPVAPVVEASFADPSVGVEANVALPPPATPTLQGTSVATWETPRPGGGSLKVVTTNMLPGYLRKNGVPYSAHAVLTEYFDRHTSYGTEWITVTTIVEDPQYLTQPFVTTSSFKREASPDKWKPAGCEYE